MLVGVIGLLYLAANLLMRWLADFLILRLLHLLEARVVLVLPPAPAKLIGQAPLLLGCLRLLQDGHVLRVVEIDLRGLMAVRINSNWICVCELVALRAGVVGLEYFARCIRLSCHAVVKTVNVLVLLRLLLLVDRL